MKETNTALCASGRNRMAKDRRLGKYHLVRVLGQGGMGSVFEAEDTVLQRRVALKVLPAKLAADPDMLQRFVREARAAARLSHPNVVTIHEVARSGTTHFIAMELVRGESAERRLIRGALSWEEATRITAEACRGLAAAHRAGLIHRDVKPSNILLGEDGQVKLADFGLVKPADPQAVRLTQEQAVIGTPQYMSPEQCRGERVSRLTDLYSLGATYFCLLTGRTPFAHDQPLQLMMAHCTEPVPDPRVVRPDIPDACVGIVKRAMAKGPAERYAAADEMLGALDCLLAKTLVAPPVSETTGPASPSATPPPTLVTASPTAAAATAGKRRMGIALRAGGVALLVMLLVLVGWRVAWGPSVQGQTAWIDLFNGRDMDQLFVSDAGTWSVQDGLLVGRGDLHYCFTKRDDFGNFHCRVEMKLSARANSGVCFRAIPVDKPPQGYEAQLGWSESGAVEFGGLFRNPYLDQMGDVKKPATYAVEPDTWFAVEVMMQGGHILVRIDGVTVTEYVDPQPLRPRGRLALQSGSKDSVVTVRKFEVRELP